jgi:hypothetical protein
MKCARCDGTGALCEGCRKPEDVCTCVTDTALIPCPDCAGSGETDARREED